MPLVHPVREKRRSAHYYAKSPNLVNKPATVPEILADLQSRSQPDPSAILPTDNKSTFFYLSKGGRRASKGKGSNCRGVYHPPGSSGNLDCGRVQNLSLEDFCKKHGC